METFQLEVWHWLILGGSLLVAEIFTTGFFCLLFGLSAIAVGIVSWLLPLHWFLQVVIWLILSIMLTVAWFKLIYPTIRAKKTLTSGEEIIGQTGMIILPMNATLQSKVRFSVPIFGADEWVCRVAENRSVQVGERVKVIDIIGNELLVIPMLKI